MIKESNLTTKRENRKGVRLSLDSKGISVNALYTGRRFLTENGIATKLDLAWQAKNQLKGMKPYAGKLHVDIEFYYPDSHRRDIDGGLKALLDSLTGVVWEDDSQIVYLSVIKEIDKEKPRIVLSIDEVK